MNETTSDSDPRPSKRFRGWIFALVLVLAPLLMAEFVLRIAVEERPIDAFAFEHLSKEGDLYLFAPNAVKFIGKQYAFNPASAEGKRLDSELITIALLGDNTLAACNGESWLANPIAMQMSREIKGSDRFRVISLAAPRMRAEDSLALLESGTIPDEVDAFVIGLGVEDFGGLVSASRPEPSRLATPLLYTVEALGGEGRLELEPSEQPLDSIAHKEIPKEILAWARRLHAAQRKLDKPVLVVLLPTELSFWNPRTELQLWLGFSQPKDLDEALDARRTTVNNLSHLPNFVKSGLRFADLSKPAKGLGKVDFEVHPVLGTLLSQEATTAVADAIIAEVKRLQLWRTDLSPR
ncbi:MAG: hypothetical protein KDB07_00240 [Planctomycetes bacterium]|nr:hypothetical protein [Planctomycetota bacterium]